MPARSIKSAERALGLFELFSRVQRPLTVAEVVRGLVIPQPSASMLLSNLAALGYLEYDRRTRTYTPNIRLVLLGSWIGRRFSDAGSLAGRLNDLHRQLGGCVYISIQNGAYVQYVMAQNSVEPDVLNIDSGQFQSLTFSASGRALLALRSDAEITGWVRRCNAEATSDRLKVQESAFLQIMADVRRNGYGENRGALTPGNSAIAVHIPSPVGHLPLAIGCVDATERIDRDREAIVRALRSFQDDFTVEAIDEAFAMASAQTR